MATIREYIQSKLSRFHFMMDEVELDVLLEDNDLKGDDQYTKDKGSAIKLAMAGIIPDLLLMPDINQGDFSIKRNSAGLQSYYNLLCTELGIENKLNPPSTISDRSSVW